MAAEERDRSCHAIGAVGSVSRAGSRKRAAQRDPELDANARQHAAGRILRDPLESPVARRTFETPNKPPITDPARWTWVLGLGFALTAFMALWLLIAGVGAVIGKPLHASQATNVVPSMFMWASLGTAIVTVVLGGIVVFAYMMRGADLASSQARTTVLLWSVAGLVFGVVQLLVLARFGMATLPKLAPWAAKLWWLDGFLVAPTFALMTWVAAAFSHGDDHDDWDDEYADDEDWDEHEQ